MDMADRLGMAIKRAEQHLIRAKTDALTPIGLTVPQYAALLALSEEPGISAAELARRCLVTPQTMTTVIRNLVAKEAVERRPHPSIGHVRQVFLSDRGRELLAAADIEAVAVECRLAAAFSESERRALVALLDRCAEELGEGEEPR
ncbi:MAG: MarR family transcriptional regulator [Actinomycetota bacterium]